MKMINRRKFLQRSIATSAGLGVTLGLQHSVFSHVRGANDDIRIGVAGLNGQGNGHINMFHNLPGVRVVALCDPDSNVLAKRKQEFTSPGNNRPPRAASVDTYADIRQMLDNKDIDAISIATPNHWHSLMTILACQAGKHVYVEKPVSQTIWEGRQMVRAAHKFNRIVQAGTQHRSCLAVQECAADIQSGKYGPPQWLHCSKLGSRENIGLVTQPQPVPNHIDYNLWAGPAPMTPVMRKSFHYDWHWQWNWGSGEMGNWAIHYVDDVRNLLGWSDVPNSVIAAGNRFAWDDNGQTPNMHFALFDYDGFKVVVEIRNLPDPTRPEGGKQPGGSGGAVYLQSRGGNYIQFKDAYIRLARGGGTAFDLQGNRIKQYRGDGGGGHAGNFIKALRSNDPQDLNAEITHGHLSTTMCHQANIAFRVGAEAPLDQLKDTFKQHDDALNTLNDMLEQLQGNQVNINNTPFIVGPKLTYDRKNERFTGTHAQQANKYLKYENRTPFIVPEIAT